MSAPELAALLADQAEDVCHYLLPNGVRKGREWKVGSVAGEVGESMGVVVSGDRAGVWQDFASGESGDLVGLWKAVRGVDVAVALREIEEWLGIKPAHVNWHAPVRVAAPRAEPSHMHSRYGQPSRTWAYRDAHGGILGYVSRFDPDGDRKQILPQSWDGAAWSWKAFPEPRPLYGLDALAARPDAPVLVVEGEKCADAAAELIPAMVVVTWPGGAKALGKVDLEPLRGRVLTLWPDADEPGKAAMEALAARLQQPCRIVRPNGFAEGWDIADAAAEGWDGKRVVEWAREHVEHWFPEPEPHPGVVTDHIENVLGMVDDRPEPLDIFDTIPVPALDRDALPWAIAEYVFDQSALIGTDPGILALSALVTLAGCADDAIQAQPKQYEYRWRESARIWGAVVAGPAEKKSPPIRRATAHVRQIDMKLAEEVANRLEMYSRDLSDYEKLKARAKGGPVHGDPPTRPKERCLMVDDATTEAIGKILRDNPRGLLMVRDELSGWFGSMDAYSGAQGKDAAFYLECYEGGPGKTSRITRDAGPIPNKSLCIMGGIQPDPMRKIAHRLNEDGLLQRFIVVCPTRAQGLGEDRPPDRDAEGAYTAIVDAVLSMRGDRERPVLFTAEARAVLLEVSNRADAEASRASTPSRMRVHLGKWQGLFVRLCLLYHVIEAAATKQEPTDSEVSRGTAETVRRLMIDYLLPHLSAFYGNVLDQNATAEHARWIAGFVLSRGSEILTLREITRGYTAWKRLFEQDQRQVMRYLVDAAWLEPYGRGWKVNPRVHETFLEIADRERARRRIAREQIAATAESMNKLNEE